MELAGISDEIQRRLHDAEEKPDVPQTVTDSESIEEDSRQSDRDLVLRVHPSMVGMIGRSMAGFRYILLVDPEAEPGVVQEGSRYLVGRIQDSGNAESRNSSGMASADEPADRTDQSGPGY